MKNYKPKALLAFSGGLDSTVLLASLLDEYEVYPILFDLGSKQDQMQLEAVRLICKHYSIEYERVMLPLQITESTGLGNKSTIEVNTVETTTVPCRNLIFLSVLSSIAITRDIKNVFIGIQDGNSSHYLDCHPHFMELLQQTIAFICSNTIQLVSPLLFCSKSSVVAKGLKVDAPLHLTRTCYTGSNLACGKCPACLKRLGAFRFIGKSDPIEYETNENGSNSDQ